jgi:hypothetical protein
MGSDFTIQLTQAQDASQRMAALCQFIEFWLGPRMPEFGVPGASMANARIPAPLKSLYAFAGRWPPRANTKLSRIHPHPFSYQDSLRTISRLEVTKNERLIFLDENQGNWDCRTLCDGDDPPVWCCGDHADENANSFASESLACGSLSRFLVSFALQELLFGAPLCLAGDPVESLFRQDLENARPLWLDGPYVFGSMHSFYLWNNVLVGHIHGFYTFSAHGSRGIEFLTKNRP